MKMADEFMFSNAAVGASPSTTVRLTAAAFIKKYKDLIAATWALDEVSRDALNSACNVNAQLAQEENNALMTAWKQQAIRANRYFRRELLTRYKRSWRRWFTSKEKFIEGYKQQSIKQWWPGPDGFMQSELATGLSRGYAWSWVELIDLTYQSSDLPIELRCAPFPLFESSDIYSQSAFDASFTKKIRSGDKLTQVIELLKVAQAHPAAMMLYIPMELMSYLIEEVPLLNLKAEDLIHRLDAFLIEHQRADTLFTGRINPAPEHFSLQAPSAAP
jgi:hypothetical protein